MSDLQQEQHPFLNFVKKNQKNITTFLVIIVLGVGGFIGYTEVYLKPQETSAADAMFAAEKYFLLDSSNLVLNGDGKSKGVLYVIKEFGGTKQANLAKFYAGISYFRLGNFNKSIEFLKDFSTNAKQVQTIAYGTIGDAYAELKNNDEALEYYKKAGASFPEDEGLSAEYLYRAAQILEVTGKNDDAIAIYKDIKTKYPKTEKGISADKFIYRLKIQP